jgi:hypothetical protein
VANLSPVSKTTAANFSTSFPCVVYTGGKFATGVNDTGGKFATGIATGINDTSGKSATGVNDTGGKQCEQLSNCWQLKINLLYYPKEIIKKFLMEDFFLLPPCQRHWWCTLSFEYLREFSKIRNSPNGIIRGFGKTDLWKKPEAKNLVTLSL